MSKSKLIIELSEPEGAFRKYDISALFTINDKCVEGGVYSYGDFLKRLKKYLRKLNLKVFEK